MLFVHFFNHGSFVHEETAENLMTQNRNPPEECEGPVTNGLCAPGNRTPAVPGAFRKRELFH
jgi:hypothetical protein